MAVAHIGTIATTAVNYTLGIIVTVIVETSVAAAVGWSVMKDYHRERRNRGRNVQVMREFVADLLDVAQADAAFVPVGPTEFVSVGIARSDDAMGEGFVVSDPHGALEDGVTLYARSAPRPVMPELPAGAPSAQCIHCELPVTTTPDGVPVHVLGPPRAPRQACPPIPGQPMTVATLP
jgi:hypothetical protein